MSQNEARVVFKCKWVKNEALRGFKIERSRECNKYDFNLQMSKELGYKWF